MQKHPCAAAGVLCAAFILTAAHGVAGSFGPGLGPNAADVIPLAVTADSSLLLATDGFQNGLKLVDTASGKASIVSLGTNAGAYATLSSDGRYVCYKAFEGGGTQQIPVVFDVKRKKHIPLAAPAPLAGTPAMGGGTIAYTLGNELIILDSDFMVRSAFDLGHHVNTIAVSPDGESIAYNDTDHQIVVLDLATGGRSVLTDGGEDFSVPVFSPAGDKVLASSAGGVVYAGERGGKARKIGKGHSAGWADNSTVVYSQRRVQVGRGVIGTDIVAADVVTGTDAMIASESGDASTAVSGGKVLVANAGSRGVKLGHAKGAREVSVPLSGEDNSALPGVTGDVAETQDVVDTTSYKYLSNMKYIHQNNDTPNYWDGNWSCNAVSAIMAMQYYNILPKNTITCNWPTVHTSDYGFYVPEKYSFNGYSYSTYTSTDPSGTTGWGGYGHITRNNWQDTKGYMRDYINQHGPTSSVDWSPTFAKAKTEIDGNKPFVLLNSLTTAGHYIVTTGYYKSQYTLIFNDPYGNKTTGVYPSANGVGVRYDWPGYNNGYSNLNTVHCYIYCRFTPPAAPSSLTATAVSTSQINLSWNDTSSCEEFVDVFRSTSSTTGYTKIATLNTNATSYSSTGLTANTTYYYQVRARTPAGSSAASNTASAKTHSAAVTIVVDNSNSGFTASSNWSSGTSAADKYGSNYRFRNTQAASDAAQWSFTINAPQSYSIQAWWCQGTNRSATAPYILPDGATVNANQQVNGGKWNVLGTMSLTTGIKTVKLSCWTTTGYVVIADAIRVVPQ